MPCRYLIFLPLLLGLGACEEPEPIGEPNLSAREIVATGGLLFNDTITIIGTAFNSLPYQNEVFFTRQSPLYLTGSGSRAKVVSVSTRQDTLRAIVPIASQPDETVVSGPVYVVYGVDTVETEPVIIIPVTRPVLQTTAPQGADGYVNRTSGQPGTLVDIIGLTFTGASTDSMVVLFNGQPAAITDRSLIGLQAAVPNLFGGRAATVVLQLGIQYQGQLYLSNSIPFVIEGIPAGVPRIAITTSGNSGGVTLFVGDDNPPPEVYKDFLDGSIGNARGVVLRGGDVYWARAIASSLGGGSVLQRGKQAGTAEATTLVANRDLSIRDLALGEGDTLYAIDEKGRVGYLDLSAAPGSSTRMYGSNDYADEAQGERLLNLKRAGKRLYWCSDRRIMSGKTSGDPGSVITVHTREQLLTVLGEPVTGSKKNITAIALDGTNLYIAFGNNEDFSILRAEILGQDPPVEIISSDDFILGLEISDLEVDNDFLYWLANSNGTWIQRIPLDDSDPEPEKVREKIPGVAGYFDLPGQ